MTAYELCSYPGAAADTLLNANLASNGLSFSVSPGDGNNYPDGSQGPFRVAIDYDNSKSEKIRCTSRINDTFTIATVVDRGFDGTVAQAHSAGAKVRAVWTATDAQEANRAAANTVGKITTKGDLLAGTGPNALTRVPVGGDGSVPVADSGQASGWRTDSTVAVLDGTFSVDGVSGAYVRTARVAKVGKRLHVTAHVTFTGASVGQVYAYSFLAGTVAIATHDSTDYAVGICNFSGFDGPGTVFVDNATGKLKFMFGAFNNWLGVGTLVANGNVLWFSVSFEVS